MSTVGDGGDDSRRLAVAVEKRRREEEKPVERGEERMAWETERKEEENLGWVFNVAIVFIEWVFIVSPLG